jgi:chitodextrinase
MSEKKQIYRVYETKKVVVYILVFLMLTSLLMENGYAQNYNPTFPRIGQLTFFRANTVAHDIWKNHDLVVLRYYKNSTAAAVKAANPSCIVLGCNDEIMEGNEGKIAPYPEDFYVVTDEGTPFGAWATAHLMDVTNYCPRVETEYGYLRYNEYLPLALKNKTNWNYFDGTFFDWWAVDIYGEVKYSIDFDRNGIADETERSGTVVQRWNEGLETLIENVREALPGKPILAHEAGTHQTTILNGIGRENWTGKDWAWNYAHLNAFKNSQGPVINFVEAGFKNFDVKLRDRIITFSYMRFGLTTACLLDAYYSADEGTAAHRYTLLYDEYNANLGYPLGAPQVLSGFNNVWVRYFDKGAVICNASGTNVRVNASDLSGGPFYKFRGSQDPTFNDGTQFSYVDLVGEMGGPYSQEGDGILLFRQPVTLVQDIVVDNELVNLTTPGSGGARFSGDWTGSTYTEKSYAVYFYITSYSKTCAYSGSGNGENKATYKPNIGITGNYEVLEWHGDVTTLRNGSGQLVGNTQPATNVPCKIVHANGTYSTTVNQAQNVGEWNSIGTFSFNRGEDGYVEITNNANGYVMADAFKFIYQGSDGLPDDDLLPPNSPENLGLESTTETSITISWTAPGPASDGDLATFYSIKRDNVVVESTNETRYDDTGLAKNTTYNYKVYSYDAEGNMNGLPAEADFTTTGDLTPPQVSSTRCLSLNTLEVIFNEGVETGSAENINNYSINNGISITHAFQQSDSRTVHLRTTTHTDGQSYNLIINNIIDRSPTQNMIAANTAISYNAVDNLLIIISADNEYELYVNGNKIGEGNNWWDAESYVFPLDFEKIVIGVKGIDIGGEASIVAYIEVAGKIIVTDESWKVSNTFQSLWETTDFVDDSWPKASSFGQLGAPDAMPWAGTPNGGIIQGLSTDKGINWIWTDDYVNDDEAYFRYVIAFSDMTPPSPPQGVTVKIP